MIPGPAFCSSVIDDSEVWLSCQAKNSVDFSSCAIMMVFVNAVSYSYILCHFISGSFGIDFVD